LTNPYFFDYVGLKFHQKEMTFGMKKALAINILLLAELLLLALSLGLRTGRPSFLGDLS